jgi:hypothetical protein
LRLQWGIRARQQMELSCRMVECHDCVQVWTAVGRSSRHRAFSTHPPLAFSTPAFTHRPHLAPLLTYTPARPRLCPHHTPIYYCTQVAEGYKQVAALLDHLNVDAANPLAVLTQVCGPPRLRAVAGTVSQSGRQAGSVGQAVGWGAVQQAHLRPPASAVAPCSACTSVSAIFTPTVSCWLDTHWAVLTLCGCHSLLLQDTARNFLCGSVADKKKYEIFMKVRGGIFCR